VRYLERSEEFAALILMSWRTRLRPEARRGFFFLGLADAMDKFFQCLRMMSSEPSILAELSRQQGPLSERPTRIPPQGRYTRPL
jgi:hypothetical protein